MYLGSFVTNFGTKTSTKSAYLLKVFVRALSTFKWIIWALFEGCISLPVSELILRVGIYITKVLYFRLKTAVTNSFFPINSTLLVVESMSSMI